MSEQRDKAFVQHSIDTGLESMQGNPFLAQRIMNQERTEQPVMKKKISFAFILAMILLIVSIATAVAGAVNEDFNTWLYRIWPEAAMKLMPVDLSCDREGIRMELINAVAEGNEVYLTFSMKDLEGDRINANSHTWMRFGYDYANGLKYFNEPMTFNEETKTLIYGEHLVIHTDSMPLERDIYAIVPWLANTGVSTYVNLLPLLEKYGDQATATSAPQYATYIDPSGHWQQVGDLSEATPVLDWQKSLEIPLADTVNLSGIGMVDGLLHVQLHYVNHQLITFGKNENSFEYYPENAYVDLYDSDEEYHCDSKGKYEYTRGIDFLTWTNPIDESEVWEEYIFQVDSKLTEEQILEAEISHPEPPIMGMWSVVIPARLIQRTN